MHLLHGLQPGHIFTCKDRIKSKMATKHCGLNYSSVLFSLFILFPRPKDFGFNIPGGQFSETKSRYSTRVGVLVQYTVTLPLHVCLYDLLIFVSCYKPYSKSVIVSEVGTLYTKSHPFFAYLVSLVSLLISMKKCHKHKTNKYSKQAN